MVDYIKQFHKAVHNLNNNIYFAGIIMIILNIGAKFITIELSPTQEAFIRNNIGRQLLLFSIVWMGTKNIYVSLTLTAVFIILSDFLFNEHSNFCILPEEWIIIKDSLDRNGDGRVSDAELDHAINILRRAKRGLG